MYTRVEGVFDVKKNIAVVIIMFVAITLCGCNPLKSFKWNFNSISTSLENELKGAARIVFINTKDPGLKFTVADSKVIGQISNVIARIKAVGTSTDIKPDYTITFYLPNGVTKSFSYWMGVAENGKDINLKDEQGTYYRIPESLDAYIVNSTKMWLRPKNFVDLYSTSLSECITQLQKEKGKETVVGVDVTSDRRMRKYTMSYEDERLFNSISAEGYKIEPFTEKGKFTYVVSYVTSIYNSDKAKILIEAVKVQDKTKETFIADAVLEDGSNWAIKISKE